MNNMVYNAWGDPDPAPERATVVEEAAARGTCSEVFDETFCRVESFQRRQNSTSAHLEEIFAQAQISPCQPSGKTTEHRIEFFKQFFCAQLARPW